MLNYDRNVTDFRLIEGHRSGVDLLRDRDDLSEEVGGDRVSPVGKNVTVKAIGGNRV